MIQIKDMIEPNPRVCDCNSHISYAYYDCSLFWNSYCRTRIYIDYANDGVYCLYWGTLCHPEHDTHILQNQAYNDQKKG